MRGMRKNQRKFWYALREGQEDIITPDGYKAGRKAVYGPIIEQKAAISEGNGNSILTRFGLDTSNTRTIGPLKIDCPINAFTQIWIDQDPAIDEHGNPTKPNDYVVSDVRKSLNQIMLVVRKANNGEVR